MVLIFLGLEGGSVGREKNGGKHFCLHVERVFPRNRNDFFFIFFMVGNSRESRRQKKHFFFLGREPKLGSVGNENHRNKKGRPYKESQQ